MIGISATDARVNFQELINRAVKKHTKFTAHQFKICLEKFAQVGKPAQATFRKI